MGHLPAVEPPLARHQVTRPDAILIAGPTASGKSAVAFRLAERLGGTIINADSMQVYRELAILTARPTAEEMAAIPHRLYGTVPARVAYAVGRWLANARSAIEEAQSDGRLPILTGGTGLYFKALLEGLAPVPDIPDEIRSHWRVQSATLGPEGLHAELSARDPAMAARLRPSDPQRIVRALEVIDATGVSLSEWQGAAGTPVLPGESVLKLLIAPDREPVYAAIDARFERMVEAGAIEEVEHLLAQGLDRSLPAMRAHGVPELSAFLVGKITLDEAKARVKTVTRHYVKRQMTWARRFMSDWEWLPDGDAAVAAAIASPHS
ncbi:MAG: tRNA (adenosine(37)-N6)-dimethylallyltransferase MiaA [Methyloceanibacter sp.]